MPAYGNLLPCLDYFYNKGKFLVLYSNTLLILM